MVCANFLNFFRAHGNGKSNDRLALICLGQIRYLDVVYDPKPLFNSIFRCDLENWRCTARDTLIQALPEIFLNVAVQQGMYFGLPLF